jgi:hypothetical protein
MSSRQLANAALMHLVCVGCVLVIAGCPSSHDLDVCSDDDACPAFYRCVASRCQPLEGRDAGAERDAGRIVRDGGREIDGGPADAGSIDASSIDAGGGCSGDVDCPPLHTCVAPDSEPPRCEDRTTWRPVTDEEAGCIGLDDPTCAGCHRRGGRFYLRPLDAPPPPPDFDPSIPPECGVTP